MLSRLAPRLRLIVLTTFVMTGFAANSVLCRLALRGDHMDPAGFTSLRIASGALSLWLLVSLGGKKRVGGDWGSALALAAYAITFSFAYVSLTVGTGALLAFGAVQASMLIGGLLAGERLKPVQTAGLILALGGLVYLVLPGVAAPTPLGATLMLAAGVAWGVYSLRGRGVSAPALATAGNFLRALPLVVAVSLPFLREMHADAMGVAYAIVSGAVTSGLGYVIWYAVMRELSVTQAAVVQLSAPVIAALGGVLLGEALTLRLVLASVAILGGIACVVTSRR